jgi:RNA polymerase sigma-54 factor
MALSAKLELRQGQGLVMTPQLQQAIKLLQLSNLELGAFVEAELERNPLLERNDEQAGVAEGRSNESAEEADGIGLSEADGRGADDWLGSGEAAVDPAGDLDTDYENVDPEAGVGDNPVLHDSGWAGIRQKHQSSEDEILDLQATLTSEETLHEHLHRQLGLATSDPVSRIIGAQLIDQVDEAGYMRGDLTEIAERLGSPLELVETTLRMLQRFEPSGICARSLPECLKLQLMERNRYDEVIEALIDNLHLLAQHNLPALRRVCRVDQDELTSMVGELRRLDPKPGLRFGSTTIQTLIPDVFVRPRRDGSWQVELNSETLPKILVNHSYYSVVAGHARSVNDRSYLQECLHTANWLVKSLDQRARTILRVSEEIVRQQDAFFAYGVQHMRPLNLKKVAEAIGMHESTVSRVTSNKYMSTNRGVFELRYFFSSAIASAEEGEAHSSEAVRHRIRRLIETEGVDDVLSDDKLVERLRVEGIDIARRTVAKYREGMHIASSVMRRREKRMARRMHATA